MSVVSETDTSYTVAPWIRAGMAVGDGVVRGCVPVAGQRGV